MLLRVGENLILDPFAVAAIVAVSKEQGLVVMHSGYAIEVDFMPSFGTEDLAELIVTAQQTEPPAERA